MYPAPLGGWNWPKEAPMDDARAKDLDETRRLAYMALLVVRTEKYELAGSLVNALVHHQQVDEPIEQVINRVYAAIEGDEESQGWLREQIARVSGLLDEQG
jgi:hypothetical protein